MFTHFPARTAALGLILRGLLIGAASAQVDEYGLKSALVFNFLQFVEWPASRLAPEEALTVCVVDDAVVAKRFAPLAGQRLSQHALRVRAVSAPSDVRLCHVVFVPASAANRTMEVTSRHQGAGILFVTEDPQTPAPGSTIALATQGRRITFDVHLDVAREHGLTISSKLLKLARRVSDGGQATLDGAAARREP